MLLSSVHLQQFAPYSPLPHPTATQHLPTVFSICFSPHYNKRNRSNTLIQVPLCSTFFHMLLNIFCSTFYPFFAYPVFIFFLYQPHYPTRSFPTSMQALFSVFTNNCLGNEISTYLIKFPWQYEFDALQIITLAPLTPFVVHRLATSLPMTYLLAMTLVSTQ